MGIWVLARVERKACYNAHTKVLPFGGFFGCERRRLVIDVNGRKEEEGGVGEGSSGEVSV